MAVTNLLSRIRLPSSCFATIPIRTGSSFNRNVQKVLTDDGRDFNQVELGLPPDPASFPRPVQKNKNKNKKKFIKKPDTNYKFINKVLSITSKGSKIKDNKDDLVLLEGLRLIFDAHEAGADIKEIYYSDDNNISEYPELSKLSAIPMTKVDRDDYKLVSKQVTPKGFLAVCSKPTEEHFKNIQDSSNLLPLTLFVSSFRDPGNFGTLIRSSAAAGVLNIFCSQDCTNVWDGKVLRSGSGAHFRVPIRSGVDTNCFHDELIANNTRLFYAEASTEKSSSLYDINFFPETIESPLAVIVGGETTGFDPQAVELIEKMNGQRLSIPLARGVESLNNHVAAAIIMYEIKRQYMKYKC